MNEKQKEWTNRHCNELKTYMEQFSVLTDRQYEAVIGYIDVIVSLSKGNAEVRDALFDVLEVYDRKEHECTKTES